MNRLHNETSINRPSYVRKPNSKPLKNLPLLKDIYSVAIGAEGGIFLACKSVDHKTPSWTYTGLTGLAWDLMDSRLFYKISSRYGASLEDLRHINLTLGPKGSYFTTTKDGPVYRDIPTSLHEKIKSQALEDVKPRQVSLGQHDSYICLWSDNTISYSVNLSYTGLAEKMQKYIDNDSKPPVFIAMNPYDNYSWFLVDANGQCAWQFKSMEISAIKNIQEVVLGYLQRRARSDGSSFTETTTLNGKEMSFLVTPETKFDEPSKILDFLIMKRFPEPVSKILMKLREPLIDGRRKRNATVFVLVGFNIGIACRSRGMRWRTTLLVSSVGGIVALGALKWAEGV